MTVPNTTQRTARRQRNVLTPLHSSIPRGGLHRPRGMSFKFMDDDMSEFVQEMALSIFADMTGAGKSFQETLGAIYLSGIDHGLNGRSQ